MKDVAQMAFALSLFFGMAYVVAPKTMSKVINKMSKLNDQQLKDLHEAQI